MTTTGIVLAAGAGTRFGEPKALVRAADGTPWLHSAITVLRAAGCGRVIVALGASAEDARALVPDDPGVSAIVVDDWQSGMAASIRSALTAAALDPDSTSALITLVDLPALPVAAVARVLGAGAAPRDLRQAVYAGRPGHPVLIGREHWAAVSASITGDTGARPYLVAHSVEEVECGDLFDGHDVDRISPDPERDG